MTADEAVKWVRPGKRVVASGFLHQPSRVLRAWQALVDDGQLPPEPLTPFRNSLPRRSFTRKGPDVAILHAAAIFSEGFVPALAVEESPWLAANAHEIILEWNVNWPSSLIGVHDIYADTGVDDAHIVPLRQPGDRIGTPYIPLDWTKVVGVVKVDDDLSFVAPIEESASETRMANYLHEFLLSELRKGRLPIEMPPIHAACTGETGAILRALTHSGQQRIALFTDIIDEVALDLLQSERLSVASGSTLAVTQATAGDLSRALKQSENRLILRPRQTITAPDVLRRLGVIAINTAQEVDLYGRVHLQSDIWDSATSGQDFARQSRLSIVLLPPAPPEAGVSRVVPRVAQADLSEREVDVIVSEHGIADLRGISAAKRAERIISGCAREPQQPDLATMVFANRAK